MKYTKLIVVVITLVLFIIPFFWLKPGFVDLGGDAGRLYFLDPWRSAVNLFNTKIISPNYSQPLILYELYLTALMTIVRTPTYLIAVERGIQLSLSFLFVLFIVRELLRESRALNKRTYWVAITAGIVYLGFITKNGWVSSLETQNQIFLNPLMFFLLLKLFLTGRFRYTIIALFLTIPYAANFRFASISFLMAFYPLSIVFLLFITRYIFHRNIPWRNLFLASLLLIGLHAFHIFPMVATILTKGSFYNNSIFGDQSIQSAGVRYFGFNHEMLGKISTELFQPTQWGQNMFVLIIPLTILFGFMRRPSKLLATIGIFFAVTFFLVSANITKLGVSLYQKLFYIPGFMMFRSFEDKFSAVFAFFFTLLFAFSFYALIKSRKLWLVVSLSVIIIGTTLFRIIPFLQGKAIDVPLYQSKNVSRIFKIDPNVMDTLSFVRQLPEGSVLTLPLADANYQIVYGKEGGAYEGVSMVANLAGKTDYPGLWSFGERKQQMLHAMSVNDVSQILQVFSTLNIRYIFYNSDSRIMDNFPGYPYNYLQLSIRNQADYQTFLASLPLTKLYEKGFYSVYRIDNTLTAGKPYIYAREEIYTRYFYIGCIISGVTFVLCIFFVVRSLAWRRNEKN